jgi:hypothetical protein
MSTPPPAAKPAMMSTGRADMFARATQQALRRRPQVDGEIGDVQISSQSSLYDEVRQQTILLPDVFAHIVKGNVRRMNAVLGADRDARCSGDAGVHRP